MKTKSEKRRENVGASSVSLQTILSNEGRFGKGGFPLINERAFSFINNNDKIAAEVNVKIGDSAGFGVNFGRRLKDASTAE